MDRGTLDVATFEKLELQTNTKYVASRFFKSKVDEQLALVGLVNIKDNLETAFRRKSFLLLREDLLYGWAKENPALVDAYLIESYLKLEVYKSTLRCVEEMFSSMERNLLNSVSLWYPEIVDHYQEMK